MNKSASGYRRVHNGGREVEGENDQYALYTCVK